MDNNEVFKVLNRHKKKLTCDLYRKTLWFFQKSLRFVIRTKENVWIEYYHVKCLENRGLLRKVKKEKAGKWDDRDQPTSNVVH